MQPIFDSHAHYDDERFDPDREELIASLPGSGVELVLNAACDLPSCESSLALTRRWPFFYCSVGVPPHAAQEVAGSDYLRYLERAARENEKAVAIGEIGLDYHYDFSPRAVQKAVFDEQLALAEALDLPVIIHSREASADTLEIVRRHHCRGVVHCFSGSAETAQEYLKLGYHIGFTGSVTFKNAKKPVEAAAQAEGDIPDVLKAAMEAAAQGAKKSEEFVSKFGRAKSYKEQTIGTPDAGAMSTALFFKGLWNGLTE